MYIGHCCLFVCLSLAAFLHNCTDPGITLGNGTLFSGFAIGDRVSFLWQHMYVYCSVGQQCNANGYWSTLMLFGQLPVKFNKNLPEREMLASACACSINWFFCFVFMHYERLCCIVAGHHTKFPAYERVILRERKLLPVFLEERSHFVKYISSVANLSLSLYVNLSMLLQSHIHLTVLLSAHWCVGSDENDCKYCT